MDQVKLTREQREKLQALIAGSKSMPRRLTRKSAAVLLACGTLLTAAAAAGPTIQEMLNQHLGPFQAYATPVDSASVVDQGIEVRVVKAVADDIHGRVYVTVRDLEGDRLSGRALQLGASIGPVDTAGGKWPDIGAFVLSSLDFVSYDPSTKTALFSGNFNSGDMEKGLKLGISRIYSGTYTAKAAIPCDAVTGEALQSQPVANGSEKILLTPGDIVNNDYDNSILPEHLVVLAPGQTPRKLTDTAGTEDLELSSMGFAADGRFHIRLKCREGIKLNGEYGIYGRFSPLNGGNQNSGLTERANQICVIQVPDGLDVMFPLITRDDLDAIQQSNLDFSGIVHAPGVDIAGDWSMTFQVDYQKSETLPWTGELAGCHIYRVCVSPFAICINADDSGKFVNNDVTAILKDGTSVAAAAIPGGSIYYSQHANQISYNTWDFASYNTWEFASPVQVEQIAWLELMGERIPVHPASSQ